MGRWFRYTLAIALLAGSVITPAVSHCHRNGDQSHSHQDCATADHDELNHDGHAHSHHHGTEKDSANGVEPSVPHLHAFFLGIDFSFPAREGEDSQDPFSTDYGRQRLVEDVIPIVRLGISDSVDNRSFEKSDVISPDAENWRFGQIVARMHEQDFLCGFARSQRSVLLI